VKEISGPSPKELKIAVVCRKKRLFQKVGSLQFISSSDDSSVVSHNSCDEHRKETCCSIVSLANILKVLLNIENTVS